MLSEKAGFENSQTNSRQAQRDRFQEKKKINRQEEAPVPRKGSSSWNMYYLGSGFGCDSGWVFFLFFH